MSKLLPVLTLFATWLGVTDLAQANPFGGFSSTTVAFRSRSVGIQPVSFRSYNAFAYSRPVTVGFGGGYVGGGYYGGGYYGGGYYGGGYGMGGYASGGCYGSGCYGSGNSCYGSPAYTAPPVVYTQRILVTAPQDCQPSYSRPQAPPPCDQDGSYDRPSYDRPPNYNRPRPTPYDKPSTDREPREPREAKGSPMTDESCQELIAELRAFLASMKQMHQMKPPPAKPETPPPTP